MASSYFRATASEYGNVKFRSHERDAAWHCVNGFYFGNQQLKKVLSGDRRLQLKQGQGWFCWIYMYVPNLWQKSNYIIAQFTIGKIFLYDYFELECLLDNP